MLRSEVSQRKRSNFVATAIKNRLGKKKKRLTYADKLRRIAGSISARNHPEWKDIDSITAWVKEGRAAANRDYSYIPYGDQKK